MLQPPRYLRDLYYRLLKNVPDENRNHVDSASTWLFSNVTVYFIYPTCFFQNVIVFPSLMINKDDLLYELVFQNIIPLKTP